MVPFLVDKIHIFQKHQSVVEYYYTIRYTYFSYSNYAEMQEQKCH